MIAILPIILGVQFLLQALVLDIQNIPSEPLIQFELCPDLADKSPVAEEGL